MLTVDCVTATAMFQHFILHFTRCRLRTFTILHFILWTVVIRTLACAGMCCLAYLHSQRDTERTIKYL